MDHSAKPKSSLFDVFLRLRPAARQDGAPRFIEVETVDTAAEDRFPKHITVVPPTDIRKRSVEKYAFTRIFEESATQLDVFQSTGVVSLVEGALGQHGKDGRDGLLATLGVTGSGKSHTILGSKTQRGITQMTMDLLYQSIEQSAEQHKYATPSFASLAAEDVSEAQLVSASVLLESLYGDGQSIGGRYSRAQTPMLVRPPLLSQIKISHAISTHGGSPRTGLILARGPATYSSIDIPGSYPDSRESTPAPVSVSEASKGSRDRWEFPSSIPRFSTFTRTAIAKFKTSPVKETSYLSLPPVSSASRQRIPRPSALPRTPAVANMVLPTDPKAEYAIIISMYEVYNDRIYDLLAAPPSGAKSPSPNNATKRRPLLFKSTEASPDRKVVAGLRKIVCATYEEAITVLETGLYERKVSGTGSNAVSSRSHGFFCIEIKKRDRVLKGPWSSSTLTIVDLAGSERARVANTAGATLAEAGKINSSLMYLGQCMQMQSDNHDGNKNIVPFRQCKLTELLFSNSFPSSAPSSLAPYATQSSTHHHHRNPQKAIMIVTADPVGDFNATSQILRYSALAREAVVPRIPSITSQMLSATHAQSTQGGTIASGSRPGSSCTAISYQNLPVPQSDTSYLSHSVHPDEYLSTIASLTEQRDIALLQVAEERQRADTLESFVATVDGRWEAREAEIREDCFAEMDAMMEKERRRWKTAWDEEADAADERLDAKIEIVTRGAGSATATPKFAIHEDDTGDRQRVLELEDEVQMLKAKLRDFEREQLLASPTKKLKTSKVGGSLASSRTASLAVADHQYSDLQNENTGLRRELEDVVKKVAAASPISAGAMGHHSTPMRSPSKKMRVLKSKKWEIDLSRDSID